MPPASCCSTVFVPFQALANATAPDLCQTVIAIESLVPGSPWSVIVSCSIAPPSTENGSRGFVTSRMFALPVRVAVAGLVLPAAGCAARDVIAVPLT